MNVVYSLIEQAGFDCVGTCPAPDLKTHSEVRDMCAAGKCHVYGKSWACPPACGDIADFEEQMHRFEKCTVVQTIAQMEDDFDVEAMMEAQETQKERFYDLIEAIDEAGLSDQTMVLSAGTCELCSTCTYPDEPCRFPDKRLVSMEAAGLIVSEVCTQSEIPYNHGPHTIAYSCCVLYNS